MVVMGTLFELASDILGDIFYDLRSGLGGGQVVLKEGLVEGEDALDFDAEGDLKCGVDHFDGVLWMQDCVAKVLVQVLGVRRLCMQAPCNIVSKLEIRMQSPTETGMKRRSLKSTY